MAAVLLLPAPTARFAQPLASGTEVVAEDHVLLFSHVTGAASR